LINFNSRSSKVLQDELRGFWILTIEILTESKLMTLPRPFINDLWGKRMVGNANVRHVGADEAAACVDALASTIVD
jgi:hypothetical protein